MDVSVIRVRSCSKRLATHPWPHGCVVLALTSTEGKRGHVCLSVLYQRLWLGPAELLRAIAESDLCARKRHAAKYKALIPACALQVQLNAFVCAADLAHTLTLSPNNTWLNDINPCVHCPDVAQASLDR
jgi:hypothetical protein